jgi:hypothetical protein
MEDDPFEDDKGPGVGRRATAFDCVECSANNPVDDGFGPGDEVTCYYCGVIFHVTEANGRLRFKPT